MGSGRMYTKVHTMCDDGDWQQHSTEMEFASLSPPSSTTFILRLLCPFFSCFQPQPFGSAPSHFVQRPDPMASLRALAIAMEEEDRSEVASYVATVLQKLANMNELLLGEKVSPRSTHNCFACLAVSWGRQKEKSCACLSMSLFTTLSKVIEGGVSGLD